MLRTTAGENVTVEDIPGAEFGFDDIGVYDKGELVRSFNSLSDDYALTNAFQFARDYAKRTYGGEN